MNLAADPKKILVVDDDHDIREIVMTILDEEGYTVAGLDNGSAVLETVLKMQPDIILLDVRLGDADGRDICKMLKERADTKNIRIIIVSATHGWHTEHEKHCRADDYINKPFDIEDLIGQVRRYAA